MGILIGWRSLPSLDYGFVEASLGENGPVLRAPARRFTSCVLSFRLKPLGVQVYLWKWVSPLRLRLAGFSCRLIDLESCSAPLVLSIDDCKVCLLRAASRDCCLGVKGLTDGSLAANCQQRSGEF